MRPPERYRGGVGMMNWVVGAFLGAGALLGLFLTANAADTGIAMAAVRAAPTHNGCASHASAAANRTNA